MPTIKDFEAAIAELEAIVKKLEEGDLPLETSLEALRAGRAALTFLPLAARRCGAPHRSIQRARTAQARLPHRSATTTMRGRKRVDVDRAYRSQSDSTVSDIARRGEIEAALVGALPAPRSALPSSRRHGLQPRRGRQTASTGAVLWPAPTLSVSDRDAGDAGRVCDWSSSTPTRSSTTTCRPWTTTRCGAVGRRCTSWQATAWPSLPATAC